MAWGNRYRGGAGLVVRWITTGGTYTLHDDYTSLDVDRGIDLLDSTAGNEADRTFVIGVKDGTAKLTFLATGSAGTPTELALVEGALGTLEYSPKGTGTGQPKRGFAAFVKSLGETFPSGKLAEYNAEFQKTGPVLYTGAW